MNIVEAVVDQAENMSKKEAKECVALVTGALLAVLKADGRARVNGLGTFRVRVKPATKAGKRLIFGEERQVAAKPKSQKLVFRAGKDVKEQVDKIKIK